ncbi:MAG: prepilin peptidase, partial [Candidatus Diapherotrites archaeon]|nr:prepilin peptidase [Candidatus Diapherotrites archaeon]
MTDLLFPALYFSISIIGLLIATYTDLKERIVPDMLTASLLILGLGLHIVESFLTNSLNPLLLSVEGTVFAFLFGYFLGLLGVWAGGDIKLLTGLAALNPLTPTLLNSLGLSLNWHLITIPIWAFTFFAYSAVSIVPYTLILAIVRTSKKKSIRWKPFKDQLKRLPEILQVGLLIGGLGPLLTKMGQPGWLILPILLLFELAKKKGQPLVHHSLTAAAVIFIAGALITPVLAVTNALFTMVIVVTISLIISYVFLIKEHVLER